MAVEELEATLNEPSEAEKRIKQLSGKVKEEAEAKEAAVKAQQEAETKAQTAERKSAFLESFSDIVSENPAAKEFKAEIEEKVMGGMSIEDAKFAVLGKAGKLSQSMQVDSPAGGSATTTVTQKTDKSPKEMKSDELRAAVEDAVKKGNISWT